MLIDTFTILLELIKIFLLCGSSHAKKVCKNFQLYNIKA